MRGSESDPLVIAHRSGGRHETRVQPHHALHLACLSILQPESSRFGFMRSLHA